jgi:hypothetical protein
MRSMILGILLSMADVAHAETGFNVTGLGMFSCGQFIATIGKNPPGRLQRMHTSDGDLVSENAEYVQWLLGFVTGFNSAHVEDEQQQVTRTEAAGVRHPFTDPDAVARKLVEIANDVEAVQGRIYIERVNEPFLATGGSAEQFRAGIERAIG